MGCRIKACKKLNPRFPQISHFPSLDPFLLRSFGLGGPSPPFTTSKIGGRPYLLLLRRGGRRKYGMGVGTLWRKNHLWQRVEEEGTSVPHGEGFDERQKSYRWKHFLLRQSSNGMRKSMFFLETIIGQFPLHAAPKSWLAPRSQEGGSGGILSP